MKSNWLKLWFRCTVVLGCIAIALFSILLIDCEPIRLVVGKLILRYESDRIQFSYPQSMCVTRPVKLGTVVFAVEGINSRCTVRVMKLPLGDNAHIQKACRDAIERVRHEWAMVGSVTSKGTAQRFIAN